MPLFFLFFLSFVVLPPLLLVLTASTVTGPSYTYYPGDDCSGTGTLQTIGSPLSCSADSNGRYTNWVCANYFPTASPSRLPTGPSVKPTVQPTATPTRGYKTGYIVNTYYADAGCSTNRTKFTAYKLGVCIPYTPFDGLPGKFDHYMAGDGSSETFGLQFALYADTNCTTPVYGPSNTEIYLGCDGNGQSWGYSAVAPTVPAGGGVVQA